MHWSKRSTRVVAGILVLTYLIIGMTTSTQAPEVGAETIEVGQPESIEGVATKGYVEIPEGSNWEEMNIVLTNPSGETQVVEAEYDEHSETFLFEKVVDEAGEWAIDSLQIVEDGQSVVQPVEDISIQVAQSVEDVYRSAGPQIDATSISEGETFSPESYIAAVTGVFALNGAGEPIEIEVTVSGAVSQSFNYFNDGLEISASEPIDTNGSGEVTLSFSAPGAESVSRTVVLNGSVSETVDADADAEVGVVELYASTNGGEVTMETVGEYDLATVEFLAKDAEDGYQIEEGVTLYWGAPDPATAPAASTNAEEEVLALAEGGDTSEAQNGTTLGTSPLPAPTKPVAVRLAGDSRFETAVAISGTAVIKTDYAILVSGDSFADALAASSLSRVYQAPIMYSGLNAVHPATLAELGRLNVKNVFLIGGPGTVSPTVENELKADYNVKRISGTSRFETARIISQFLLNQNRTDTAILVNGYKTTDALVSGAYASHYGIPILYTQADKMDAATFEYLKKNFKQVIIVGGVNSVSEDIMKQVAASGIAVERASGSDRYATSVDFANTYFGKSDRVVVASGLDEKLPDGLAGGALGGLKYAPVLLSGPNSLPDVVKNYFKDNKIIVSYLLGGQNTLTDNTLKEIMSLTSVPAPTKPAVDTTPDDIISSKPSPIAKPVADPRKAALEDGVVKIMLDPGHGWNYNQGVVKTYFEGNQMIYLSYYLQQELESYGFEVTNTRMPEGMYASAYDALLAEKAFAALHKKGSINNDIYSLSYRGNVSENYDLLISLHSNAPFNISASELWDSVTSPNQELSKMFLNTVVETFGHGNRGIKYRYRKDGLNWYGILRSAKATNAILIEHGFHTSAADANKLLNNDFLKKLAKAEAKTLADYYGLSK